MSPGVRRRVIEAMIAQLDGTTDALLRYEHEVGVSPHSATAKMRLADARLALVNLTGAFVVEAVRLSRPARELLERLQRGDVDYLACDEAAYFELRDLELATVIFRSTGNRVFATDAGKTFDLQTRPRGAKR